jgi:hypothetical protein
VGISILRSGVGTFKTICSNFSTDLGGSGEVVRAELGSFNCSLMAGKYFPAASAPKEKRTKNEARDN